jgi:lysophospholipase
MKLISIPANPVPDNFIAGALKTPDGVTLRFARWLPPAGRRGTVCIFQGRSEWIEKYFETVRDLRARGFAVAALDWRGQGLSDRALSDRRKGYVRSFTEYDLDLETFMREIVLPDCPPPLFAIGHSTGANVLLRAAHRGRQWFDRMVLIAPLIALGGVDYSMGTGWIIVRALRLAGLGGMYVPRTDTTIVESRPIRCATPATPRLSRQSPRSRSERRLSLGAMPHSARCARCANHVIQRGFANRC